MRATLTLVIALGAVSGLMSPVNAAADPAVAGRIIDQLVPLPGQTAVQTRGIRPAGTPSVTPAPATQASVPAPKMPAVAAKPREASLTVPFRSGSADVSPSAARVLDDLADALASPKLAAFKFRIEGHTDTTGLPETNKALSEQRAASVVAYLSGKRGIDRARLTPVGMGQDGLLIATGPGVADARNRRVLVVNLGE